MKLLGKLIRKLLLICLVLILVPAGWFTLKGYTRYKEAVEKRPFSVMVQEIENRPDFVPYDALPSIYIDAVISVEDRRFGSHPGIDPIAIGRALLVDIQTMSLKEGGSTITQQLMKNQYFDQNKKLDRKTAEVFAALAFEKSYNKDEIFALYVNTIYFGDGYYGIAQASQGYFGKTVDQLTEAEAVMLAGLPQAPSAYSPTTAPDLAYQRMQQVLEKMIDNDVIDIEKAQHIQEEVHASFFCYMERKQTKNLFLI